MAFITVGTVGEHKPNTDVSKLINEARLAKLVKSGIVKEVKDAKPAVQK